MRVKDGQIWARQLQELGADETSVKFRDFLVAWGWAADRWIGVVPTVSVPDLVDKAWVKTPTGLPDPRGAALKAFQETEEELGFISVEWLGQMLLLITLNWIHGDELLESLSPWERRVVDQAEAVQIAALQQMAAEESSATMEDLERIMKR